MLSTFIIADNRSITVSIGSGNFVCTTLPFHIEEDYSYSQQIYLQSEINLTGYQIEKLIFTSNNDFAFLDTDVVIYMAHTNKDVFESSSDFIDNNEFTEVYNGSVYTPSAGEIEIELDTAFLYNNVDNLVLAWDENTPGNPGNPVNSWCSYGWFGHRTYNTDGNDAYRSIRTYHWSDINPQNPFLGGWSEKLSVRNNIQMVMEEQIEVQQGDINNDGLINIVDVVQLVNIIINNEQNDQADLNNDNTINVLDIITLVNISLN